MAPPRPSRVSCKLLISLFIFLIILVTSHAKPSEGKRASNSRFDFIRRLQGCHRGQKVKDLRMLKKYLKEFGYLNYSKNDTHADDDDFDDHLESALKTYQRNYHLKATGTVDAQTVSRMSMPRCGVPDIANGTNWMGRPKRSRKSPMIHTVSHFSFFQGNPRWPASKTHLTYAFLPNTIPQVMTPVASAFNTWASATHFTFSQVPDSADISIGFFGGDHGDGNSFDGRGGVLAHAFSPTDGRFHLDAEEAWSIGPVPNAFDLETVALHEIGHLLGLGHSSVPTAIMWPSIPPGAVKGLGADDVQGINVLYRTV